MNTLHKPSCTGRYLGLSLFVLGAVFLFDPFVSVFDLLPDALGFFFCSLALSRLSDMDDRLAEAARGLRRLAFLGLARIAALAMAFGVVSPSEQPVFILLSLFSLAVLDIIVLLPTWKNLSGGLIYLGGRCDATAIFDRSRHRPNPRDPRGDRHRRNLTERYFCLTSAFFVLREILVVLPELSVLTHEKGGVEGGQGSFLYDFVGLFRELAALIAALLGLVWLVRTVLYVRRLKGDKPFIDALHRKYQTEILPRTDLFARRAVKASFLCLCLSAVFTADVFFGSLGTEEELFLPDLLPDFLTALCLLLALLFIRRFSTRIRPAALATVGFGSVSFVCWLLQIDYLPMAKAMRLQETSGSALRDFDELMAAWQTVALLQVLQAILLVIAYVTVLRALYRLTCRYTGVMALSDRSTYASERTESIHARIRRKLRTVGILAIVVALSGLFQWLMVPHLPAVTMPGDISAVDTLILFLYDLFREGYAMVDSVLTALLLAFTIHATSEVSEQLAFHEMMGDSATRA